MAVKIRALAGPLEAHRMIDVADGSHCNEQPVGNSWARKKVQTKEITFLSLPERVQDGVECSLFLRV